MKKEALERVLWGEYYYLPKSKTVSRKPKGRVVEPMFVQLVLRNLWQAYECLVKMTQISISIEFD
jgi:ribosome assembly protein 1